MENLSLNAVKRILAAIDKVDLEADEEKIPGGLYELGDEEEFYVEQLIKGVDVEMEHTEDPAIALEIAMDHLIEDDHYYDALEEVEG